MYFSRDWIGLRSPGHGEGKFAPLLQSQIISDLSLKQKSQTVLTLLRCSNVRFVHIHLYMYAIVGWSILNYEKQRQQNVDYIKIWIPPDKRE